MSLAWSRNQKRESQREPLVWLGHHLDAKVVTFWLSAAFTKELLLVSFVLFVDISAFIARWDWSCDGRSPVPGNDYS
jgi:hypothetical protein